MSIPQAIGQEDIEPLGNLLDDVFRRSRGVTDQHVLSDFPLVFDPANHCNCRVIVQDGRIVSHAALWPRELIIEHHRLKAGIIVLVATHPAYRMRGFAASLMRDLERTMQQQDFDLGILWTGVPDFYRKLRWETIVPHGCIVELDHCRLPVSRHQVTRYDPVLHLDGIMALYQNEPIRLSRSRAELRSLLALPKINVWVVARGERVDAYLVHGEAVNKRGIMEYGGDLQGIIALAGHVVRQQPADELCLLAYHTRPDLLAWVDASGLRFRPLQSSKGMGHEMISVVDPSGVRPDVRQKLFIWGLDQA